MPHFDVTLLICTHNNADILERTLDHVARQRVDPDTIWEVLVVDNNCADDTSEVLERYQADERIRVLRVVKEGRQGIGFARKTGILASRGRLIGFVDDDCFLSDDWISSAVRFARQHPQAGAFGGRNSLLWEEEPQKWCIAYGESLARQCFGNEDLILGDCRSTPCGAGLVLRREAVTASRYLEGGQLIGRHPVYLGAGEDAEVVLFVRQAGYEVWYTPTLTLQHYVPRRRTELPYLCRIHRGFGRAESHLQLLARNEPPTIANSLRRVRAGFIELWQVVTRFPRGFCQYASERPSWWLRWYFAIGCIEGALWMLVRRCARLGGRHHG